MPPSCLSASIRRSNCFPIRRTVHVMMPGSSISTVVNRRWTRPARYSTTAKAGDSSTRKSCPKCLPKKGQQPTDRCPGKLFTAQLRRRCQNCHRIRWCRRNKGSSYLPPSEAIPHLRSIFLTRFVTPWGRLRPPRHLASDAANLCVTGGPDKHIARDAAREKPILRKDCVNEPNSPGFLRSVIVATTAAERPTALNAIGLV